MLKHAEKIDHPQSQKEYLENFFLKHELQEKIKKIKRKSDFFLTKDLIEFFLIFIKK